MMKFEKAIINIFRAVQHFCYRVSEWSYLGAFVVLMFMLYALTQPGILDTKTEEHFTMMILFFILCGLMFERFTQYNNKSLHDKVDFNNKRINNINKVLTNYLDLKDIYLVTVKNSNIKTGVVGVYFTSNKEAQEYIDENSVLNPDNIYKIEKLSRA